LPSASPTVLALGTSADIRALPQQARNGLGIYIDWGIFLFSLSLHLIHEVPKPVAPLLYLIPSVENAAADRHSKIATKSYPVG